MVEEPEMDDDMVLAATDRPVPLSVRRIDDDRVPEGMVGLGSFLDQRLIARCAVPTEVAAMIEEQELFEQPVQLVLAAREEAPGLQCRLFAVVEVPQQGEDEPREPWADSVPGAGFDQEDEEEAEPAQAMVFLGQIVRFERDRRHKESLALETADVLRRIVEGQAVDVVDKVIEDLMDGSDQDHGAQGPESA
jgi:hypothetical protein